MGTFLVKLAGIEQVYNLKNQPENGILSIVGQRKCPLYLRRYVRWRGRIVWPSARAWKARRVHRPRGFKSLPLRHLSSRFGDGEWSCALIASSAAGSCAAGHRELRQGRKAAAVSGQSRVPQGRLVAGGAVRAHDFVVADRVASDKSYRQTAPASAGAFFMVIAYPVCASACSSQYSSMCS